MGRYENCTHFDALYDAAENCFPSISRQNACTVVREVMLAPNDYEVEFSNKTYTKTQIMKMLAKELALSCVYESPEQTHFDILENAANIIKHMNDGYVSREDYQERTEFLEMVERYEFTLFTAFCLLRVASPDATERLEELRLNITRLREIRDLIRNYTRDTPDVEIDRDEYERAKPIYKMLKSLQSLGYNYNFSPKERSSLDIDHEDDNDLTESFNAENWLKRIMLLELRFEVNIPAELTTSTEVSTENSKPTANVLTEDIGERIAKLRGTYNKRRFDKNRFLVLEKAEESSSDDEKH
ncbi:MAG: hypothetical protein IJS88_00730 [Alphaproteobacteria bacterium]|nr:hypothetical protein [Alphaproteobacteria bacterium]